MKTDKDTKIFNVVFAFIILAVAFFVSVIRVKERMIEAQDTEIKEVFSQSGNHFVSESTKWNDTFYELFEK